MKKSHFLMWSATLLVVASLNSRARGDDYEFPSTLSLQQVQDRIDQCNVPHPRLLTNARELEQLKSKAESDPLMKKTAEAVVLGADALLQVPPITRKQQGRRLLGQSRRCVKRLLTLATAFHLTGDSKYAKRAEQEMLTVAGFSDWNPSHFLDVAEMTFGMAIGYDWLFHELSADSRQKIRQAIVDKGVALPLTTRHKGWVRSQNNWGQVCHGGLTAGALAVLEDEPQLAAKTVHNALHNVRFSMAAYAPHGSYPEGPGYWMYGTSYNVLLIAVLESALGADFGLTKAPGFALTGQYPALACGPSGLYFNYSDGGSSRSAAAALFWFAERFHRPDWLLGEHDRLRQTVRRIDPANAASYGSRLLPLVLLWIEPEQANAPVDMPLNWSSEGEVPITVHRSSWTDPKATFVGFKGGSPSANHGQMDIGSFVLDADGKRWAMDLGAEGYHGIESRGMNLWNRRQDSDRWTIFRQSNAGHNTLVIDGQLQRAAGHAKFIKFSDQPGHSYAVLDMSDVYKGQAESVLRGVALLPSGQVVIQDEITGLTPGTEVRWGMITPASVGETGARSIRLSQDQARLTLDAAAPHDATWQQIDCATPRHPWDSPNRGTQMPALMCVAPSSGELDVIVVVTPGSSSAAAKDVKIQPLEDW
jgi:hypothetical protein